MLAKRRGSITYHVVKFLQIRPSFYTDTFLTRVHFSLVFIFLFSLVPTKLCSTNFRHFRLFVGPARLLHPNWCRRRQDGLVESHSIRRGRRLNYLDLSYRIEFVLSH